TGRIHSLCSPTLLSKRRMEFSAGCGETSGRGAEGGVIKWLSRGILFLLFKMLMRKKTQTQSNNNTHTHNHPPPHTHTILNITEETYINLTALLCIAVFSPTYNYTILHCSSTINGAWTTNTRIVSEHLIVLLF